LRAPWRTLQSVEIREATVEDAEGLLAYLSELWADDCDTLAQRSSPVPTDQDRERVATPTGDGAVLFVGVVGGRIVGMLQAAIPQGSEFQHNCEFGVSVLASHRGQGIGRALLQRLLEWAEVQLLWRVELEVHSTNATGIGLYSSMGFVEDGRRENAVKLRDGRYRDLVHMYRYTAVATRALQRAP
jgi:L-amino acid N-acyltransferase YncA